MVRAVRRPGERTGKKMQTSNRPHVRISTKDLPAARQQCCQLCNHTAISLKITEMFQTCDSYNDAAQDFGMFI